MSLSHILSSAIKVPIITNTQKSHDSFHKNVLKPPIASAKAIISCIVPLSNNVIVSPNPANPLV